MCASWYWFIASELVGRQKDTELTAYDGSNSFTLQEVISVWEKTRVRNIEKEERGK
jgi:hypothetical protein